MPEVVAQHKQLLYFLLFFWTAADYAGVMVPERQVQDRRNASIRQLIEQIQA